MLAAAGVGSGSVAVVAAHAVMPMAAAVNRASQAMRWSATGPPQSHRRGDGIDSRSWPRLSRMDFTVMLAR